jgi:5'-phosphate synthase pdxT subunit
VGPGVEVLSKLQDGTVVAIRKGNILATSFHPEITGDKTVHKYFLSMVSAQA